MFRNSLYRPVSLGVLCICFLMIVILTVSISCNMSTDDSDDDPTTPVVLVDLSQYSGLALRQPVDSNDAAKAAGVEPTELIAIDGAGSQAPVFTPGMFSIDEFLIGNNNNVYLLFSSPVDLYDPEAAGTTLLAKLDTLTNEMTSVIDDMQSIRWNSGSSYYSNPPIQFDSDGNLYLVGMNDQNNTVLRMVEGTESTDLINDNISLSDFLVTDVGSALFFGQTVSTSQYWLRKFSTTAGLSNILVDTYPAAMWMKKLPDNRYYIGIWGANDLYGIAKLSSDLSTVESDPYISGSNTNSIDYNPTFNIDDIPAEDSGSWFMNLVRIIETTSGTVIAINLTGSIFQLYPDPTQAVATSITTVTTSVGILDKIILAGTDDAFNNKFVLYDVQTNTETDLMGTRNIEIYEVQFEGSLNEVIFNGLDFATNQRVIGNVNLIGTPLIVTTPVNGNVTIESLQLF